MEMVKLILIFMFICSSALAQSITYNSASSSQQWSSGTGNNIYPSNGGNVGIGTINPGGSLDVGTGMPLLPQRCQQ